MTRLILIVISILTLCGCNSTDSQNKIVEIISNNLFMQDKKDGTKTTKQILDKYLPSVVAFAQADTSTFYYGYNVIEYDSLFRELIVGQYINKEAIIATEIDSKDTLINFFYLDKNKWKLIGSEKINIPFNKLEFEDLDGDGSNEVIISTARNLNGNTWQEAYYYSEKTNTINYAGSFSTDYEIKKDKKQIEETYEGSWYMDNSKTLYEWRQEKLVPLKKIILVHDRPASENGRLTFEFYENSTNDIEGLKLKFKEPYIDSKKQQQLWDNFFSGK